VAVILTFALTAGATAWIVRGLSRDAPVVAETVPAPDGSVAVASTASVASVASTAPTPAAPPASEHAARPRAPGPPPPRHPSTPTEDCRIPYTVDATGRKIYKRSCL
jgi:hypothetical protein